MRAARVAITGIGVVSRYGVGRERFWTHVNRGCSATRAIDQRQSDPDCDLDCIPNATRVASPAAVLCNCLGFGSRTSAIVRGAPD